MRFCILSVTISTILWVGSASATDTTGKEAGEITGKDGAPMIRVPAGQFPMGVPKGDRDGGRDEYPRHDVQLDAYYIDKYEVSHGRYAEFV